MRHGIKQRSRGREEQEWREGAMGRGEEGRRSGWGRAAEGEWRGKRTRERERARELALRIPTTERLGRREHTFEQRDAASLPLDPGNDGKAKAKRQVSLGKVKKTRIESTRYGTTKGKRRLLCLRAAPLPLSHRTGQAKPTTSSGSERGSRTLRGKNEAHGQRRRPRIHTNAPFAKTRPAPQKPPHSKKEAEKKGKSELGKRLRLAGHSNFPFNGCLRWLDVDGEDGTSVVRGAGEHGAKEGAASQDFQTRPRGEQQKKAVGLKQVGKSAGRAGQQKTSRNKGRGEQRHQAQGTDAAPRIKEEAGNKSVTTRR
ncbi:hypothetical protein C8R45DRAFT_924138 [Mycena sanguinolenta]|nr:hypothetical protein C8R45DRAFT_924138 [Mycena sanguinolenta]